MSILRQLTHSYSILCDDVDNNNHDELYISLYKREVLLSYRLLFGSSKAQRMFRNSEQQRIPSVRGIYDPLLKILCGKPHGRAVQSLPSELWLESWWDLDGNLNEQNMYSASTDFPLFGPRLLDLQKFNLSQKPNKISDIWRDRRNTIQWYTFWAVIFLGGFGLVIGVVQMALAAAQLKAT